MINRLTLAQMAAEVRSGRISAVELIEAHLNEIELQRTRLNPFVSIFAEEAVEAARQADEARARRRELGPLHGIPITVKDSFDMAGQPTYCGSKLRLNHRAAEDSTPVRRLREAGAIFLGKTNTPEFLYNYETDNYVAGRTNNPWNPERTSVGSSGGEAAAIASFCSAGGMGSDGGGSIREPAHFCGICGLKPTPGRVPAVGHFPLINHPGGLLGVAGPMARTAADVRLLFEITAGHDAEDPFSAPVPVRKPEMSGIRIGVWEQFYRVPVQAPMRNAVRKAAEALRNVGFTVEPFEPRGLERAPNLWWFFFGELAAPFVKQMIVGREQEVHWTGLELLNRALEKPAPTMSQVVENLAARDAMRASLIRQMAGFQALLTPACGVVAFPHRQRRFQTGEKEIGLFEAMMPLTYANLLGLPAMVLPFDRAADGLPAGIQFVGRPYDEELLLNLAVRLEQARGPFEIR